jgi:glycine/D-amino acid oxidase-like deaminating enzyme
VSEQDTIAVIGAGVISAAVACALAHKGHRVLLLDRAEPGVAGPSWVGARPVLADYLPAIGGATGPAKLFYATGHQHIGLTIAPVTAELIADVVAERTPLMIA